MKSSNSQSKLSEREVIQRHLDSLMKNTSGSASKSALNETSKLSPRNGLSPGKNSSSSSALLSNKSPQSKKDASLLLANRIEQRTPSTPKMIAEELRNDGNKKLAPSKMQKMLKDLMSNMEGEELLKKKSKNEVSQNVSTYQNSSQYSQRRNSPDRERTGSRSPSEGRKKTPLKIFLSKAVSQIKKAYDVKGFQGKGLSNSGMKKSNSSSRLNMTSRPVTPNDYFSNPQNSHLYQDTSSFIERLNNTQMSSNNSGGKSARGNTSQLKTRLNAERGLELLSKNNYLDFMLKKKDLGAATSEYSLKKPPTNMASNKKPITNSPPKLITLPENSSGAMMKKRSSLPNTNVEQGASNNGSKNSFGDRRHSNPSVRERERKENKTNKQGSANKKNQEESIDEEKKEELTREKKKHHQGSSNEHKGPVPQRNFKDPFDTPNVKSTVNIFNNRESLENTKGNTRYEMSDQEDEEERKRLKRAEKLVKEQKNAIKDNNILKDSEEKSGVSSVSTTCNTQSLFSAEDLKVDFHHIIEIEDAISNIYNEFKNKTKITNYCKQYLNVIAEGNLEGLEKIFKSEEYQVTLRNMLILERIVMIVVLSLSFEMPLKNEITAHSLNLLQYVHQNFILLIEILLDRHCNDAKQQEILEGFKKLLIKKKTRDTSKMDKALYVEKNNKIIMKILKQILKAYERDPFLTIGNLLENIDTLSVLAATQSLMECFYCVIMEIENKIDQTYTEEDTLEEESGLVEAPYLPAISKESVEKTYTLVLDLDETLVHYEELEDDSGQFLVRPYAEAFLEEMAQYFEIVIFTAALQDYADYILDIIDSKKCISYRLYRKHTTPQNSIYRKDLSRIGRDLHRTIIVDNLPENFLLQAENGIFIQSWYGEPEDRALYELAPLLKSIVVKKIPDVREALKKFREKMMDNIEKGTPNPHLNLNLD